MNILHAVVFALALLSCSNDDDKAAAPYEQYGSTFTAMPKAEDAIIYQVNIRAFSQEGTLNGVRAKLDDIKALGANVVYLMPIYPVGQLNSAGGQGSPYAVKDYKAVNPDFGSLEDLRTLVNEAHSKNMAVILDWVANHTAWDNAWITDHPDWYQKDEEGNIIIPPGTNYNDVAQLDFDNKEMRAAMIDAMQYWVYTANIDGFRCDYADFVGQGFWTEAIAKVRSVKSQELLMLAEGTRVNHFQAGFNFTFGFNFFSALEQVFNGSKPATYLQDSNATEYANNYTESQRVVRYTTNHDVNLSDGTPYELFNGRDGSLAAFVVAAYMKSVPMIYNGQEIGYNQRIDYFNQTPIDWNTADAGVLAEYKKIIAFRSTSNAIKSGSYTGYSSNAVSVFTMKKDSETVLVLSNLTNVPVSYIVPTALGATSWKDAFSNAPFTIGTQVTLQAHQYLVLKN
ncbi:alpha-amylase family glycosyl hydrolase [Flavobacterium zepuense]|nr:alpha-amylase family glycosyl hydrolase [Flavobacterium zepuense]